MRTFLGLFKSKPSGLAGALGTKGVTKIGSSGKLFTHMQEGIYDIDLNSMAKDCFEKYKLTFISDEQGYQGLEGDATNFSHPEEKSTNVLSIGYYNWMTIINTELTPYGLTRFLCSAQCTTKEGSDTILFMQQFFADSDGYQVDCNRVAAIAAPSPSEIELRLEHEANSSYTTSSSGYFGSMIDMMGGSG